MRWTIIGAATLCAACTTGAYQPGVAKFTEAAKGAGTIVSDEALELRKEYRVSFLNSRGTKSLDLPKLVCEPLAYTAEPLGSSNELSSFGGAARDLASPPDKPTLWDGVASLFTSYELPVPKKPEDLEYVREDSYAVCADDYKELSKIDEFLITAVGSTAGEKSVTEAISGILEIVGPAVTEALAVVDEHRRASALRDFFSDKEKVARLKSHVTFVKDFAGTMDTYRRRRALERVHKAVLALPEQGPASDPTKAAVIEAANKYDLAFAAQMKPAFAEMSESVDGLEKIANGEDEAVFIRSAYNALTRTVRAVEGLQQLSNDPAKKKRLQQLIDQMLGKKPKKEGAAPQGEQSPASESPAQ